MSDFVSLNIHHDIPYRLVNYLSYDYLSPKYKAFVASISSVTEPKTYSEAIKDPRWVQAIKEEIQALENNNTWTVVSLPEGKTTIRCKWIFKVKYKARGEIERFKAKRL